MTTRIVAGSAGGIRLRTPAGDRTRPTSERVREALFARLEHLGVVGGGAALDLFAGSGALGLEALSRGARRVVLVDAARSATAVCRANARAVGRALGLDPGSEEAAGAVEVRDLRAERYLEGGPGDPFDLVLVDPPYALDEDSLGALLEGLCRPGWLAPEAVVAVERSTRTPEPRWPAGLSRFDRRDYGETVVWLADPAAGDEA